MSRGLASRLLFGLVVVLYGSLGLTRPLTEWLRAEQLLLLAVVAAFSVAVAGLVALLRSLSTADRVPPAAVLLAALAAALLLDVWAQPEERVHLATYLVVGVLAWLASGRNIGLALLLALAVGAGDELLQMLFPSRVFDLRDLLANAGVGAATVLLVSGGRRCWFAAPTLVLLWLALRVMPMPLAAVPPSVPAQQFENSPPIAAASAESSPELTRTEPALPAEAPYAGASIVFITVDALRADHLRPWGEPPVPVPAFEQLRRTSVTFEQVFANAAWTSPGMVAFLTGLHPSVHGVEQRGVNMPASALTFLDTLSAAGYATWGFAGDSEENYKNLGFRHELNRSLSSEEMLSRALAAQEGPAFVWLHLREIHAPYNAKASRLKELGLPSNLPDSPILNRARKHYTVPRADFPGRHGWLKEPIRALYAAELANEDEVLGRILARLEGIEDLLVVVSADHGEELLDHDGIGHASTTLHSPPHPELVRIPLFVRLPDGRGAGEVRSGVFQQVDLVPTLGALIGVPATEPREGVALDGLDLSAALLAEFPSSDPASKPRSVLVSTSPCGWQCPPERQGERLHALVRGLDWQYCDPAAGPCEQPFPELLGASAERAALLRRD